MSLRNKFFLGLAALATAGAASFFFFRDRIRSQAPEAVAPSETSGQAAATPPTPGTSSLGIPGSSGSASASPSPHDLEQLKVLNEIFASKDDNDPRLDKTLKHFSPAAKKLLRDRYQDISAEKRNQKGTVVFLLGREIASAEDIAFLKGVLTETPCLSLADCSREEKTAGGSHDPDNQMGVSVTLAYPQLVALLALERQILKADPNLGSQGDETMRKILSDATHSPVPAVAAKATEILARLKH